MKYFFETYGCQMNKAESASAEQKLIARGWQESESAEDADLILINTCSVRATAESRIHGRLGAYTALRREGKKKFTLIVMGCMAQRLMDGLKKQFPVVDYVVGNFQKKFFDEIFEAVEQGRHLDELEETPVYTFDSVSYEKGSFSAFVPIMHGCNNFCTYCIVPYVRGREISRNPQEVLAELDQLNQHGVKEITVLGQNVNSYCWNLKENVSEVSTQVLDKLKKDSSLKASDYMFFPQLLELIADHLRKTQSSIGWVRFMSSHPKDLSDDLIDVIAREEVVCRHIHLPVQHGSTAVLKRMNRVYTREHYLELVKKIRKAIPNVSLTSDILLGFPGETEEDFEQTVDLMKEVGYETAYMYYYNPREGTPAASYPDQIPVETKKARLQKIIDLQQEITKVEMKKQLGTTVKALVEGVSHNDENELIARTERDERVVFAADKKLIGQFVKVNLDELSGITFRGTLQETC
ncbi:MAG: tRNA (N6-isopentenyl adenosine(37)-C2)-methylthiotransferase MiaB [Treponemataceae bacterium]|nr:tRNA (N6-isopentenyl adenosine(37)-C2)-methylthiotransferase MiaB [Treponemataceae bacterium]